MTTKPVVVTGASGHIGFHVALQLLQLGYKVILLIRRENKNVIQLKESGAQIIVADLLKPETYRDQLSDIDALFHIASVNTVDIQNEENVLQDTFELTRKVIDTAVAQNVKTIIYTSSVVVLDRSKNPDILIDEDSINHKKQVSISIQNSNTYTDVSAGKNDHNVVFESPYVKGKFLAEGYCDWLIQQKNVDIRRIYPSWVLGSNNPKVTPPQEVIASYLRKGQWYYFDGGVSIACVKSVAKAHINAWLKGLPNEKYITGGNNISFKTLYTSLAKHTGFVKPFIFVPKWLIYFAAVTGKFFFRNRTKISPQYVDAVIGNYSWYSSQKAIAQLDYTIPELDSILNVALMEIKQNNKKD